jgi:hypothetical protein
VTSRRDFLEQLRIIQSHRIANLPRTQRALRLGNGLNGCSPKSEAGRLFLAVRHFVRMISTRPEFQRILTADDSLKIMMAFKQAANENASKFECPEGIFLSIVVARTDRHCLKAHRWRHRKSWRKRSTAISNVTQLKAGI